EPGRFCPGTRCTAPTTRSPASPIAVGSISQYAVPQRPQRTPSLSSTRSRTSLIVLFSIRTSPCCSFRG
ncbi:hypothetical protein B1A_04047, partial [mine drainage metagenome]